MKHLSKQILSILLAVVMLIGLLPTAVIPVFAEESEEQPSVDSEGYILIWSYEQLVSVAKNAGSDERYRLATDIYQTDSTNDLKIWVWDYTYFSLDLNGHVLSRETRSLDSALFFVCDGSTLNIYDTSPDSTGTCIYNNNYVSDTCSVINNSGGNVIINGGNYIVKMYNPSFKASVLYGTSGEFTVYDGYFDSTQASNGNAVNMHYSNSLYDEPNCTIYGGRFYSQRTCIEARSLANYSDVYYPYVFVLGGEFYTKRSNGDEYEGNFAYCNNGWGRVIAANGLVPARSLNARDQRYATGTTTTVETLTGEPGNGWKYATVTPPPRIVSEQLPKEDRWYSLCWRDYLKAAKENESYDFWTANQEAIEAELAKIDGFSVTIFDTEVVLNLEDKGEIESVRWYVSASPDSDWTELVDYQNITGPVTQDPPKPGKTLYYRAVVTRKGGTEYEDIIYVNCEEPTEDVTPAFTTQPTGGTVGYNERHTVNWATNFDAVKQELVRYSSAGSVLQTTALSAGAFQAGLSYMADGYYYRIRAYYNNSSYIESDKIYVTTDPYFTPNYEHGNEEGDIITGITYVPNGDGTFNANVHVDLNYVDGQMLQYYWASTGYYWYDHNNKLNYGIGTTDTSKLVFTLYNLGENLEPGKEWKVKVYLADDPYADYEWCDVDFHYVTDTVPELKPEDVVTPEVYVGGVGMYNGNYLAVGATATQTTKPSGGYAYYKDGTLTLNNYSYEGKGYQYDSSKGYYAVIYSENDLTLILIGNNTLTQTYSNSDMIYVDGANLTVGGDGKLTGTSEGFALYAYKDITINGGTVEVSTYYRCILSYGEVIINDGDITAESENLYAIYSSYGVTVNGGNVTAIGDSKAISCGSSGSFTVAEGMNIQASTTADGELGEYVAANHNTYKKIVIKPAASTVLKGDVNADGKVDLNDATALFYHINGLAAFDGNKLLAADVNGDGKVDLNDATSLFYFLNGLSGEL